MFFVALTLLLVHSIQARDLVQTLQQDGETVLIDLVQKAGLASALGSGTFTIFAPTNDAFAALPQATLDALSKDTAALADILKYHVVAGAIQKSDASNELQLTTLAGTKIRVNIYSHNNVVTVEGSKIKTFDLQADNGYVHVIDKVMMPPQGSIVDIVAGNSDFSTLLQDVKSANLVSALQGENLTVFAPTNEAFSKISHTYASYISRHPEYLKEILEYHVVPHTEYSAGLYNREYLRTIDSHHDHIRLSLHSSGVYVNDARVTTADISATNGVVHVIDHVLIPNRHWSSIFG